MQEAERIAAAVDILVRRFQFNEANAQTLSRAVLADPIFAAAVERLENNF
jgi:hypothetical protein